MMLSNGNAPFELKIRRHLVVWGGLFLLLSLATGWMLWHSTQLNRASHNAAVIAADLQLLGLQINGVIQSDDASEDFAENQRQAFTEQLTRLAVQLKPFGSDSALVGIQQQLMLDWDTHVAQTNPVDDRAGFLASIESLRMALAQQNSVIQRGLKASLILAALALVAAVLLVLRVIQSMRKQLEETRLIHARDQHAITTLLDDMSTLADGDLTVTATVADDITGAIADALNYAVEALRELVITMNTAANKVANTSAESRDSALKLAHFSSEQAAKIESASKAIVDLNRSIEKVSENAGLSADVAEQSLGIAQRGVETVRKTIEGMDSIRENIHGTSKRIKRLGESSQEIGDIVGLITDIADQTNILALNAAIQASSAGEGGRGFAVVADEVQRLAERAANASKQIEVLVRTIQSDTKEAIQSMEQSTAYVVSGAQQSEAAGHALEEIENVSTRLAEHIHFISDEAREQSIVSAVVRDAMDGIQTIAQNTLQSANRTASAIGELAEQAEELRHSTEGFKLPDEEASVLAGFDPLAETEENPAFENTEESFEVSTKIK
jgi:twitching motility protein PilJ